VTAGPVPVGALTGQLQRQQANLTLSSPSALLAGGDNLMLARCQVDAAQSHCIAILQLTKHRQNITGDSFHVLFGPSQKPQLFLEIRKN